MVTDRDGKLRQAATIGQSLLEQNQTLSDKYEAAIRQHATVVEELEQEAHRLRLELKSESTDKVEQALLLSVILA